MYQSFNCWLNFLSQRMSTSNLAEILLLLADGRQILGLWHLYQFSDNHKFLYCRLGSSNLTLVIDFIKGLKT